MVWQILTIWAVIATTIIWFIHDERRLVANGTMTRASYFHERPRQHHGASDDTAGREPISPRQPPARRQGLSPVQRDFLKALSESA